MRAVFREELLKTQLEIQEQAFRNISQEIHDNIGQHLSIAKMNMGIIDFTDPARAEQINADSRELVGQAIRDLRDISHTLHPEYVSEKGLLASVQYEAEMLLRNRKFKVSYEVAGEPVTMDGQKELILFRFFQEAVANAVKHSGAASVAIRAAYSATAFTMEVADDGHGFDTAARKGGFGIRNMQGRAELIGGSFAIVSTPGSGTTVTITLPLGQPKLLT